jgi:GntR family transcriptional regulator of arabinose operon
MLASKYEQMVEILRKTIENGTFVEGGRITSENELSRQYGISRNTVREAISSLVQQGYLTRTQGKGTFVTGRRPPAKTAETYAIFLHAHSHVFEAETRALVRAFQRQGAMPIVIDVEDFKSDSQRKAMLENVMDQGVSGLVVEDSLLPLLAEIGGRSGKRLPLVAAVNYAYNRVLPVKAVVSDFILGAAMGTRHLIGQGRRKILFVIHRARYAEPGQAPHEVSGLYGDICRGYDQAMTAADLGANKSYFFVEHEFRPEGKDRERLSALLRGPDRPDAVFAFGDYRAKHVIDLAAEAGLQVPEDLAVIGYWNTPWAEMTRVPLTSVSIREDEIARTAAERLIEAHRKNDPAAVTAVIEPVLVVRGSCGGRG